MSWYQYDTATINIRVRTLYAITVRVEGVGAAEIRFYHQGWEQETVMIAQPEAAYGNLRIGDSVDVEALEVAGYDFVGWQDGGENPRTETVDGHISLAVVYEPKQVGEYAITCGLSKETYVFGEEIQVSGQLTYNGFMPVGEVITVQIDELGETAERRYQVDTDEQGRYDLRIPSLPISDGYSVWARHDFSGAVSGRTSFEVIYGGNGDGGGEFPWWWIAIGGGIAAVATITLLAAKRKPEVVYY